MPCDERAISLWDLSTTDAGGQSARQAALLPVPGSRPRLAFVPDRWAQSAMALAGPAGLPLADSVAVADMHPTPEHKTGPKRPDGKEMTDD